jgi:thioredoxin-related protein
MKSRLISIAVAGLLLVVASPAWTETVRGKLTGGIRYTLPEWFKTSFLDFKDDIEEAGKQDKHLIVFLHLDECPYCVKMLNENFVDGERRDSIQKHFDVIGVNIRGALELVWVDGASYTERALATSLSIIATPTVIFLDSDGNKVLQINGYREPRAFGHALDFVQTKRYRDESLAAYLDTRDKSSVYVLRSHPQFSTNSNFVGYQKPLAVLFEDRQCVECAAFHDKVLNHPAVLAEIANYHFVRLDTDSNKTVVTLDGKTVTAGQWAKALGLSYRPAVVLFDEGREIARVDWRLYHFHFSERLRYVGGGYYKRFESYSKYSAARREELLAQGATIDYAE